MTTAPCLVCGTPQSLFDTHMWTSCATCQADVFRPSAGPLVLVSHETAELRHAMGETLWAAGYQVVAASQGSQVMDLVRVHKPLAVVLDVGLTGTTTFQILEKLRAVADQTIKSVLVASVFNKTAYKRQPSKLYGADDYVEQHHIVDSLARKVSSLIGFRPATPPAADIAAVSAMGTLAQVKPRADMRGKLRVRALAHSIVADIALYHQGEFETIVQGGDAAVLDAALQEGRRLLEEMAGSEDRAGQDPVGEAFRAFVEEMRKATT